MYQVFAVFKDNVVQEVFETVDGMPGVTTAMQNTGVVGDIIEVTAEMDVKRGQDCWELNEETGKLRKVRSTILYNP